MPDPNDYTVGWICALHVEYVAAQEFLDEEHEAPNFVAPNDTNDYTLGAIGKHKVVIAVLPDGEYGTASAAVVATNLLHSFPNIRIGLMVGIGGGAPNDAHDIHLGDIVVSATRTGESGVFQYDFGKTIQNKDFQHTRVFGQPPSTLRTAIAGLQAQYKRKGHRLAEAINGILERNVRLRPEFGRPQPETDRLLKRDITHDPRGCADFFDNPAIHYGVIASANQLMKDATIRDKLAADKNVLCFEMEAAGLMDQFPCLVIRGICDYSDSHKSKEWQGYAALAAAAYARDLLRRTHSSTIQAETRMSGILSQALTAIRYKLDTNQDQELLEWLAPVNPESTHVRASKLPASGTGSWFIDNDLRRWLGQDGYPTFLVLRGKSGAGKTTLFANVVQRLDSMRKGQSNTCLAYFYCTLGNAASQEPVNIIGSLAAQLSFAIPSILDDLRPIFAEAKRESSIVIMIDAINESTQWKEIIRSLLTFSEQLKDIHILVSTTKDVASLNELCPEAKIVDMKPATVQHDIAAYVHQYLENDETLKIINSDVKADIKSIVVNSALGSFRWVQLSLENLSIQRTKSSIYQALRALPGSLQDIYATILDRISLADQKLVREALSWLSFAKRPLTLRELNEAVVFEESYTAIDEYNLLISSRILPRISQGLIELDNDQVYLAHSSIKEFLTSDWIRDSKVRYFGLDSETAHKDIMRKCISYLCLDYFRCGYATSDSLVSDCLKARPLLEYAAYFWATERLPQKGNFGFWVQILIPDADPEDLAVTQPLYYAASFGLVPVVKAILDSVPDLEIDSPGGRHGSTPLFVASNSYAVDPSSGYTVYSFAMQYDHHLEALLAEYVPHNSLKGHGLGILRRSKVVLVDP
ncbi:Ankyrin repeat-containing domain protein [Purpureocillium lavendulum]|uniref:Ankyrin repeat-containing domain protein n=1 Tax=Purpureocillium lavendulum TaxID=1247861 RepID=A0AB34FBY1_9HYPO|nr:Ankyrin repeat-containing domain protein [Purpureocillium lavendulum]